MFQLFGSNNPYNSAPEMTSAEIANSSPGCDPTIGNIRAIWGYTGNPTGVEVSIEYSMTVIGGPYFALPDTAAADDPYLDSTMDGIGGFSSLDSTFFRVHMKYGGVDIPGSPVQLSPTYPCL